MRSDPSPARTLCHGRVCPAVSRPFRPLKRKSRLIDVLAQPVRNMKANTTYAVGVARDLVWRDASSFGADGSGNGKTYFRDNGDGTSTKVLAAEQNCVREVTWVGTGLQSDYKSDVPSRKKLGDMMMRTVNQMNDEGVIRSLLRHLKIGAGLQQPPGQQEQQQQQQQQEEEQEEEEEEEGHHQNRKRKRGQKAAVGAEKAATHQVVGVGEHEGQWFDAYVDREVPTGTHFRYTGDWYPQTELVRNDERESRVRKLGEEEEGGSAVEVAMAEEDEGRAKWPRKAKGSPSSSPSSSSSSSSAAVAGPGSDKSQAVATPTNAPIDAPAATPIAKKQQAAAPDAISTAAQGKQAVEAAGGGGGAGNAAQQLQAMQVLVLDNNDLKNENQRLRLRLARYQERFGEI